MNNDLAISVIATLAERDQTLACAESLTGGLLGATLTDVPGASKVFIGGAITYATHLKERMLGVDKQEIEAHSVISPQVSHMMAHGIQELTQSDWAIGLTGVAGPSSQDGHAPGEVWITVLGPTIGTLPSAVQTLHHHFTGDRNAVREASVGAALGMLLRFLAPV